MYKNAAEKEEQVLNTMVDKYNERFEISSKTEPTINIEPMTYTYTTGKVDTYTVQRTGVYKLETWGAKGGYLGANGGYAVRFVYLQKGDELYICVGGAGTGNGSHATQQGGYNGGGTATVDSDGNTRQGSGGGATHIAKTHNLGTLDNYESNRNDILIVAGGGGGAGSNAGDGTYGVSGVGGGVYGDRGEFHNNSSVWSTGGTQSTGGESSHNVPTYCNLGTFGKGADGVYCAAGGGWYGGAVNYSCSGGGSSYIGWPDNDISKAANSYDVTINKKTYTNSTTPGINETDGKAIITFVE